MPRGAGLFALFVLVAGCATSPKGAPPTAAQLVTEVFVHDLKVSRVFYEKLGFATTVTEPTFLELQFGGRKLFLSQREGAQPAKPAANIRIGVPDVDRYYGLAKKMGARVLTPIGDRVWGERDFLIVDPDGFGLRFASLRPGGKW